MKAEERQDRGYQGALASVPTVPDDEWRSQFDAATALGVSLKRVGFLIHAGSLDPVHNQLGQAGVSASSVDLERQRRADAGPIRRAGFFVLDTLRSLARGI